MKLVYNECNCSGSGLFNDLGKFKTVDKYLTALANAFKKDPDEKIERPETLPLDCGVRLHKDDPYQMIIYCGQLTAEAEKIIRKVKRYPAFLRKFMTDYMSIVGDDFERELFFTLSA